MRVLLVEHDPADAELCLSTLRGAGYTVQADVVATPEEFILCLRREHYDLVLSVYNIPGWSGMDALKLLGEEKKNIPFLLVTGSLGDEMAVSCVQQGVTDYVLKESLHSRLPQAVQRAIKDRTMREEAERNQEALRLSEARYRDLVENSICGIYQVTVPGQFLHVNSALCRMLGYESKQELLELSSLSVYQNPADREILLEQYRKTGHVRGAEVEWKRKDGSLISVQLSAHGVKDAAGNLQCIEVIAEDITERRALEKQLRQGQKFEAIGQLAGGISHDFNNVIGAVMGWAELGAEQAPEQSRLQEYFKKICVQAARAAALTRQLLAFAKRQILEPQNIQINSVVAEVLNMLEKVIGKDVEIKVILAPELATVRADRSQIEQILMNLCLNARDAMPHGGRLIIRTGNVDLNEEMCRRKPGLSPGLHAELTVSDNGIGMDVQTREHMYDPFFTTKDAGKGTGLGLATVFGIVRQHEGFIAAESELGHGATFRIYLPASMNVATTPEPRPELVNKALRGGTEAILLADDHEGVRDMARTALESYGYQVLLATDGENAVHLFRERKREIDLVILDLVMPRLGGRAAAALMRELCPNLPVILTTSYTADLEALAFAKESGAALLQKPYDPRQLARRVRELLDHPTVLAGVSDGPYQPSSTNSVPIEPHNTGE